VRYCTVPYLRTKQLSKPTHVTSTMDVKAPSLILIFMAEVSLTVTVSTFVIEIWWCAD
jgi:hypothetical protein